MDDDLVESAQVDIPPPPNVVVIGESEPARVAVRLAVQQCGFVVRAAGTLVRGVELTRSYHPDLVLVIEPQPMAAASVIHEIVRACASGHVVVMTSSTALHDAISMARAGTAGYVSDRMEVASLGRALRHVLAGEVVISRDTIAALTAEIYAHAVAGLPGGDDGAPEITKREQEVLDLLRAGLSTHEIAEHLGIAPVTVRTHVARIVRKRGVRDRYEAVRGA